MLHILFVNAFVDPTLMRRNAGEITEKQHFNFYASCTKTVTYACKPFALTDQHQKITMRMNVTKKK